jgi:hypothetical protein
MLPSSVNDGRAITLIVIGLASHPGAGPASGILMASCRDRWLRKKYTALKQRYPRIFSPIETRRARARQARHADRRSRRGS